MERRTAIVRNLYAANHATDGPHFPLPASDSAQVTHVYAFVQVVCCLMHAWDIGTMSPPTMISCDPTLPPMLLLCRIKRIVVPLPLTVATMAMEMVSYRVLTVIAQVWTEPDISVRSGDQNAFFENMPGLSTWCF
jgi:hypothetical protein